MADRLRVTPGVKLAYYKQDFTQFADNGKTVGNLGGAPSTNHVARGTGRPVTLEGWKQCLRPARSRRLLPTSTCASSATSRSSRSSVLCVCFSIFAGRTSCCSSVSARIRAAEPH